MAGKPKPITNIDDPRLVRALAHPLRVRIMALLEEAEASPAELARILEASLGVVAYHVRRLETLGLVKLVRTGRVRGAIQHFYRATERPRVSDEAWARSAPAAKQALLGATISQISEYVAASAAAGGFDGSDAHLTRTALRLDAQGWAQLTRAFGRLLTDIARIEEGVQRRAVGGSPKPAPDGDLIQAGVVLMLFEALSFTEAAGRRRS